MQSERGPVSVELLLDEATERAVRADWDALADRGLSSLAAHVAPSNRPHVSLYSGTTLDRAIALHGAAVEIPFGIRLGPPILFGAGPRRVLARSVVPSAALLGLHAAVADQVCARGGDVNVDDAADAAFLPGNWIPHVTIARRVQVSSLEVALGLLGPEVEGTVVGIRLWDSESRLATLLVG